MRPWKAPPHEVFTILPVEKRTFTLFPKLPYELQHMIWLEALSQERLIKVHLGGSWDDGRYVGPYKITLRGPRDTNAPILNPLLLTCSDSRRIAKRFYRVQMACEYHSRKDEWNTWYPGVLYLCPELDIVHISGFEHFVEFATDVYNNDRDRKGLLNVAIGERTFTGDQLPHLDRDAAKAAVYRLQRLIFEAPVIGISRDKDLIEMPWSVPCCGSTTTFDRLPTERRALDTLPLHVAMHADIQWRRRIWRRFLAKAEIDRSQCKFGGKELMLNLMDPGDDEKDETDWENALHKIQDAWIPWPPAPTPDYVPPMVTGFWIVPWKALPKHGHEDPYEPYFVDIREYPPELCVAQPSIQLDIGDFKGPVAEWQHPMWRKG